MLVTVNDKRANDSLYNDTIRSYKPIIASAYDYYPFGSYMPSRHTEDTNTYCFTSTITEHVTEVTYLPLVLTTGVVRCGGVILPYAGGGVLVHANVDGDGIGFLLTGLVPYVGSTLQLTAPTLIGTFRAVIADTLTGVEWGSLVLQAGQAMQTEFAVPFAAMGSVGRLTITSVGPYPGDIGIATVRYTVYTNTTRSVLANVCSGDDYRYGFNGQMKVNEMAGKGNWNTALYWEYGTREAQRKNQDPVKNPSVSPYAVFADNPIWYSDILGDIIKVEGSKEFQQKALNHIQKLTNDEVILVNGALLIKSRGNRNVDKKLSEGTGLIRELVGNKFNNSIKVSSDGANSTTVSSDKANRLPNGKHNSGSDGEIEFNPDELTGGVDINGSSNRPPSVGLGHEMEHLRHGNRGMRDPYSSGVKDPDGSGNILSKEEMNTRHDENKIRREQGLTPRKTK